MDDIDYDDDYNYDYDYDCDYDCVFDYPFDLCSLLPELILIICEKAGIAGTISLFKTCHLLKVVSIPKIKAIVIDDLWEEYFSNYSEDFTLFYEGSLTPPMVKSLLLNINFDLANNFLSHCTFDLTGFEHQCDGMTMPDDKILYNQEVCDFNDEAIIWFMGVLKHSDRCACDNCIGDDYYD